MTKKYDKIKNFSTTISVEKTIAEIEKMLSMYGATKIMKEYDFEGNPEKLVFAIITDHGEMPVKLPVNTDKILDVFKTQVSDKRLPKRYWDDREQAARVGWRIIKDWLDAQLTLLNIQMVKVQEIFLPYAYDSGSNQTLFEKMEANGFAGYIDAPEDNDSNQVKIIQQ
jgi:hypothetical protein